MIDGSEIAAFIAHQIPVLPHKDKLNAERIIEAFLVWRAEKNGPAEAATSPSRGSTSPKGNPNMKTNSTAAACPATVPYSGHSPVDEIDMVFAQLRTLRLAAQADSQGINDIASADIEIMLGRVIDQLDPIRAFLAENEDFTGTETAFLECRREWFARKVGAA